MIYDQYLWSALHPLPCHNSLPFQPNAVIRFWIRHLALQYKSESFHFTCIHYETTNNFFQLFNSYNKRYYAIHSASVSVNMASKGWIQNFLRKKKNYLYWTSSEFFPCHYSLNITVQQLFKQHFHCIKC